LLATLDIVIVPVLWLNPVMVAPGAMPGGVAIRAAPVALKVAALDKTTVVPLIEVIVPAMTVVIVVPTTEVPATVSPTANPAVEDTEVTLVLPKVAVPVNETPNGCPLARLVKPALGTPVMTALPLVRVPVVVITVCVVVAVALFDMVIALPIAEIVVPDGRAAPEVAVIGCPTISPLVVDTDVMLVLPAVRRPESVTWLVAVAAVVGVMTMLVPLADTTVALAGMPVPLIGSPAKIPLTLDTPVMVLLPLEV
jgi:hypothetical protein